MKIVINILLIAVIIFLGWQFFNLYIKNVSLEKSSDELTAATALIKTENVNLASDINYFSNPENQEKELKSKTNYKKSGEKMIIIIPPATSTTSQ
ncbi:MAG: septum formation initiator family protein [Patescibacteria group bacterium]